MEKEQVNHPYHYQQGIEPIEVIESWDLNFNLGNVIKYTLRDLFITSNLQDFLQFCPDAAGYTALS